LRNWKIWQTFLPWAKPSSRNPSNRPATPTFGEEAPEEEARLTEEDIARRLICLVALRDVLMTTEMDGTEMTETDTILEMTEMEAAMEDVTEDVEDTTRTIMIVDTAAEEEMEDTGVEEDTEMIPSV
jgi:hypothetical protein